MTQRRSQEELVKKGLAKVIYDIDEFVEDFTGNKNKKEQLDEVLEYYLLNSLHLLAFRKNAKIAKITR